MLRTSKFMAAKFMALAVALTMISSSAFAQFSRYEFVAGDSYDYLNTTDMTQKISGMEGIPEEGMNSDISMEMYVNYTVVRRLPLGVGVVQMSYDGMSFSVNNDQQQMEFDTENPGEVLGDDPNAQITGEILNILTKIQHTLVISPTGDILANVTDYSPLLDLATPGAPDPIKTIAGLIVNIALNYQSNRDLTAQQSAGQLVPWLFTLPLRGANVGDTWNSRIGLGTTSTEVSYVGQHIEAVEGEEGRVLNEFELYQEVQLDPITSTMMNFEPYSTNWLIALDGNCPFPVTADSETSMVMNGYNEAYFQIIGAIAGIGEVAQRMQDPNFDPATIPQVFADASEAAREQMSGLANMHIEQDTFISWERIE
ncbi:MAG: hypothetical protein NUW37_03540 [Planctomycetes bacterium]|nr:hypothetical protein [Planctomycetota bacterium]